MLSEQLGYVKAGLSALQLAADIIETSVTTRWDAVARQHRVVE